MKSLTLRTASMALLLAGGVGLAPFLEAAAVLAADGSLLLSAVRSVKADDLEAYVGALADDTFEGREAGSRGGRAAGTYIAQKLRQWKLEGGAGDGKYFQTFGSGYRNVLAWIPGHDPSLRDEVIVVGAHYDHVGYGTWQNSYGPTGYIHNGADDNASGTAALLELAEAFARYELLPRRSLLLAWWDGEEKGLLGSEHWVAQPTVPLARVRIALNLDMIGRLRRDSLEVSGTRTASGLRQLVARQNTLSDLTLDFTWDVADNSDHYSFFKKNIPFLMFHTGLHDDYHRPSDDVERINFQGAERVSRLLLGTVLALANDESFGHFRFASRSERNADRRRLEQPMPPAPGRLGIRWDPDADPSAGVRIVSVATNSAAERAGLVAGDRIVSFAGQTISSYEGLRSAVLTAPRTTWAEIVRAGQTLPQRLDLQVEGEPVRVGLAWRVDDAEPGTVIVTRVVPASAADRAGLRPGDRLYELNGQRIPDDEQLRAKLLTGNSAHEFFVEREGRTLTIRLAPREDLTLPGASKQGSAEKG